MKQILFFVFILSLAITSYSQCENDRYREKIFESVSVTSGIPYGSNINYQGNDEELLLDIYQPNGDDEENRALIILVHGGSFIGGARDEADVIYLAEDYAKMGYVVASISYRIGVNFNILDMATPFTEAVLRGVHDGKAAIRYFYKNVEDGGNTYNIDSEKIFMAGVSAGGFIAVHNAYMDEESEIPDYLDMTQAGLGGGIEGESGNAGYDSGLAGVINICGALVDTTWIAPGDAPICNFHGPEDGVVPYGSDIIYALGVVAVTEVDGSESIDIKADELGITNCFEIYEGQGHVPHVTNAEYYDTTLSISSNFLSHLICPTTIELDCEYRELTVGVEEFSDEKMRYEMWPNPANERLYFSGKKSNDVIVSIVNSVGVEVKNMIFKNKKVDSFSVSDLASGIYFVSIKFEEKEEKFKIIIK